MARKKKLSESAPLRAALLSTDLISVAKERWKRADEWESDFRRRFISDVMFANGDADNGYQWPDALRAARDVASKPCLTLNIIAQHNGMISNELRKNKSSIKVVGVGNGATSESAACFRDLIRRIEYQSNAQASVYTIARQWQIDGGIGWARIATDYAGDDTFDQEIFLRPILDPLTVYIDPDCKQFDCSDAQWAFVFDSMLPEDLDELYPEHKGAWQRNALGLGPVQQDADEKIQVCEYFVRVPKKDKLVSFVGPGGRRSEMLHSRLSLMDGHEKILDDPKTRLRNTSKMEVRRYFIVGNEVVGEPDDEEDEEGNKYQMWLGSRIPLVPAKGKEIVIRGRLDRKGHTRAMKDPQRMLNYHASSAVEHIAMQTKTPWYGSIDSISELEQYWQNANNTNTAFLPFKHLDPNGEPIPPQALPQRVQPPTASPAYGEMMDRSAQWTMMVSGQFGPQLGMAGPERTGEAVKQKQDQSDTATFYFQDNYETFLQSLGRQLIELIPLVYDTQRIIKVQAEDGVEHEVVIDPTARQAYLEHVRENNEVARRILNPQVGKYDVAASVGPAYGTKRDETVEALTLVVTQAPQLVPIIGDLLVASMDFDKAQEAAQRLKRMVPPAALGQGPTPQEQQLQQQNQALMQALSESLGKQAKDQLKLVGKDQMRDIDVYKAETERMKVLFPVLGGGEQAAGQLEKDAAETDISAIPESNREGVTDEAASEGDAEPTKPAPRNTGSTGGDNYSHLRGSQAHPSAIPGSRRAPDGDWYIGDPSAKGKYLKIVPKMRREAQ